MAAQRRAAPRAASACRRHADVPLINLSRRCLLRCIVVIMVATVVVQAQMVAMAAHSPDPRLHQQTAAGSWTHSCSVWLAHIRS